MFIAQGIIATDFKLDNFSFVNTGGDNFKVAVLDAGGFHKFTGPTAVGDAKKFQTRYDQAQEKIGAAIQDGSPQNKQAQIFKIMIDPSGDVSASEMRDILKRQKVSLLGSAGGEPGFKDLLASPVGGDIDVNGEVSGVINFPTGQKGKGLGDLDISKEIADQGAFNQELLAPQQSLVGEVAELNRKADGLLNDLDSSGTGNRGSPIDLDVFKLLAAEEVSNLNLAAEALTDTARLALVAATVFASESALEANCAQMRVLLAKGNASDELKKKSPPRNAISQWCPPTNRMRPQKTVTNQMQETADEKLSEHTHDHRPARLCLRNRFSRRAADYPARAGNRTTG